MVKQAKLKRLHVYIPEPGFRALKEAARVRSDQECRRVSMSYILIEKWLPK
jgi:hypothetical protein